MNIKSNDNETSVVINEDNGDMNSSQPINLNIDFSQLMEENKNIGKNEHSRQNEFKKAKSGEELVRLRNLIAKDNNSNINVALKRNQ